MAASQSLNGHRSVVIKGLGAYTPDRILTNDQLSQMVDTNDEWIVTRTGIRERRIAADDQSTSDLAAEACKVAMERAGVGPDEIDMVLVATITPDMPFPSTAAIIQERLGIRPVGCFDIEAACAGFVYALEVARGMIAVSGLRNVLVVGAEKLSSITDWEDRGTCILFGDGAGAAVVGVEEQGGVGILRSILKADGTHTEILKQPGGGSRNPSSHESVDARMHYLQMSGREVFKHAVKAMGQAAMDVIEAEGLTPADIACIIPHQANMRIIEALSTRMKVPIDRFFVNLDRYGNTSAASIPIALSEAFEKDRLRSGEYAVLASFGAGLTWGASLIKWH